MTDQEIFQKVNEQFSKYPQCRDCRHIIGRHNQPYQPGMIAYCLKERDLIEGQPVTCEYMRGPRGGCQQPGYLFEARDADPMTDLQPECSDPDLSPSCPKCNANNTWRWSRHYQCCTCNHRWE